MKPPAQVIAFGTSGIPPNSVTFTLKGGKTAEVMGKQRIGFATELVLKRSDYGVGSPKFAPP